MRRKIVSNNLLLDEVSQLIADGERVVLLTKGRSMLPFIVGERDSVELAPIDRELSVGDIVLAKIENPDRYVLHRILKIEADKIVLMGDGNIAGVEECNREKIVALVTKIITPNRTINPHSRHSRLCSSLWQLTMPCRYLRAAILKLFVVFL